MRFARMMQSRLGRGLLAVLMAFGLGGVAVVTTAAPASASVTIGVANADGGLYWRSGPDWNTRVAVSGFGVYPGTTISIECYVSAGTLPPEYGSTSHLWYKASHVSGPGRGDGWIHDHFVGTWWNTADRVIDGVPRCGESSGGGADNPPIIVQPAPDKRGTVYFSPYSVGSFMPDSMASVIGKENWQGGSTCDTSKMVNVPTFNANTARTVTTLAGWSAGRVGPLYYLKYFPERWTTIDYVVMIDPGSFEQLNTSCDKTVNANGLLYDWLNKNKNAKLVIFSGAKTEDYANPSVIGGKRYYHRGIQEIYFKEIRKRPDLAARVMVCNYQGGILRPTNELHQQMFWNTDEYIDKPPLGNCPNGGGYWHP